jgi:beta-glucosidase
MGGQKALLEAVVSAGKPFVLVLINTKPLVLPETAFRASAIVECFNPGMLGGRALAELLFGELNPSGKLSMTIPRHVGQLPIHYNVLSHQHGGYTDITQEPAFPFGFGLSYTRYSYSNLRVTTPKLAPDEPLQLEVDVANVGERDGVEVVQVYLRDVVTSVTWPPKTLVAFARVALAASEKMTVRFEVPFDRCALVDAYEQRVVEPGEFEVLVGGSSRSGDLLVAPFEVQGELRPLERIPGILRG